MPRTHNYTILSNIVEEDETRNLSAESSAMIVSPISSIVRDLGNTSLSPGTPKLREEPKKSKSKDLTSRKVCRMDSQNKEWLFKNAFKIRSTPEGPVRSKPKGRRLLGMASRRLSSPEAVSPSVDKENGVGICSPQKIQIIGRKSRCPLEDCDPNSQDSGYGASFSSEDRDEKSRDGFQFAEPLGVAPRRSSVSSDISRSPMRSPTSTLRSSPVHHGVPRPSLFRSISSGYESMDDGFNDLIDIDVINENTRLPNGISSLLSGDIVSIETMECSAESATTPEFPRTKTSSILRRSFSLQNERSDKTGRGGSTLSKVRSCLFRSPSASSSTARLDFDDNIKRGERGELCRSPFEGFSSPPIGARSFKRQEHPAEEESPKLVKRSRKSSSFPDIPAAEISVYQGGGEEEEGEEETESVAHANIKSAIHRSTTDSDLTGDFSKPCVLPLAEGQHEDLKSITAATLAGLIRGEFNDSIGSFTIVDCRYPYEFDAGHIKGAVNLYNKDLIEQKLLDPMTNTPEIEPDTNKRNILVFHCEFSFERGPNLSRFLRNIDRQRNKEHYPALHYPELYLLHGGYERFYREQKDFCFPQGYRPMRHPDHEADLRQFRSKSKSWQGEKSRVTGMTTRTNLKRLGF